MIGNVNVAYLSTTVGLTNTDIKLSTTAFQNYFVLSSQVASLSNQTNSNISSLWFSTNKLLNSTIASISSISTFYNQIAAVQTSVNSSASTLSTTIGVQNTSTYTVLRQQFAAADIVLYNKITNEVGVQMSTVSTFMARQATVSTLSTVITNQLLSSISGTYRYINTQNGLITSSISTLFVSSLQPLQSTVSALSTSVQSFVALSTNISTISYKWISSFVSTSQYYQDVYTFSAIGKVSSSVSTLQQSTNYLMNSYSTLSTLYSRSIVGATTSYNSLNSTVIGLQYELKVLTTSSILAGIYDEFMDLEYFTSTIIGSTIASVYIFESSLAYSTTIQNMSTANGYFNFYVSTLYASTLSTLIPSTIAFTSSMVSTLYSTSYHVLTSSFTSTITSLTVNYNSTISSYTYLYISTVDHSVNSTVLGYLSTPGAALISTISTIDYIALSTFQSTSAGQLANQSTLFYSTLLTWQSSFYDLSGTVGEFIYLQSSYLLSTMTEYPSTLNGSLNSTNISYTQHYSLLAEQTLTDIENSTNTAYIDFVNGLGAIASTQALSTLYTEMKINLTGNNYVATLDFATYRNFNINVYNIINGQSNYLINYQSNYISKLDYRGGIININISTVGTAYDNNNKQLRLDVYRWGLPTTVYGDVYPYISSAAYTIQYQYNIINSVVYTSLLNVYPKLAIQNPTIAGNTIKNVYLSSLNTWSGSDFWRGSPINVAWTNYSFFPYGTLGAAPFNPDVLIDIVVGGVKYGSYGPYPLSQSTATVYAPYLTQQRYPVVPTTMNVYIVGLQSQLATTSFNTIIPGFDDILITPQNYPNPSENIHWIGGQELVCITDDNNYPLYGLLPNVVPKAGSPYYYYDNNTLYKPINLTEGPYNTIGTINDGMVSTTMTQNYLAGNNWLLDSSASSGYLSMYISLTTGLMTCLANVTALGATARLTISDPTDGVTISFTPQITVDSIESGIYIYNLTVAPCLVDNNFFPNSGNPCYLNAYVRNYFFTDTGGAGTDDGTPLESSLHIVDYTKGAGFGWYLDSGDVAGSWSSVINPYGNSGLYSSLPATLNAVSYANGGFINATFAFIVLTSNLTLVPITYFNFYLSDYTYISVYFDINNKLTVKPSWSITSYYTLQTSGENFYTLQIVRTTTSLTLYLSTDIGQYLYPDTALTRNFITTVTAFGSQLYTYTIPGVQTFVDRVQMTTYNNATNINLRGFYVYMNDIPTVLSTILYAPSTFVGPSGSGLGADEMASADIRPLLTSNALWNVQPIDAINRLSYYNLNIALGNTPVDSNATAGMRLTGSVYYNNESYQSTVITTSDLIQNFSF